MKIANIEMIRIIPAYAERYEKHQVRMDGVNHRAVCKVETDNGIVGYCEYDWPGALPDQSTLEPLIGRSPFEFLNNRFDPALGGALYDVMGKYLEVPAHKLMGQKVRDAVRVAAWTRPCPPALFREEVARAVKQGYMVFKMHTSGRDDPIEQTLAAEEVAPEGFKLHYDFNASHTVAGALPLIREMEKHPIVGFIEDPLPWRDIDGWRMLRRRTHIPFIMHNPLLGGIQEVLLGAADIYLIGGGVPLVSIGDMLTRGTAYGLLNIQVMTQFVGGTLAKALGLHIASVLPTATAHMINCDDLYGDDITKERIAVTDGFSLVPTGPGLGYEVDEKALARCAAEKPYEIPRLLAVLHLPSGNTIYSIRWPDAGALTGHEEGMIRGVSFDLWEDDGSEKFERMYARVQKEGPVREAP